MATLADEPLDAVVVGAGISGLCAARRLAARGMHVRVLEARDRPGGRMYSARLGADTIDLGGQWIGPTQNRIAALARELGVSTFRQYWTGAKILSLGGRVTEYRGFIPRVPLLALTDVFIALRRIDALRARVPLDRPYEAPGALDLDSMTVESWKRQMLKTSAGRALLDIAVRAIFAAEPRDLSFLHFLFYLNSGGGLELMGRMENGAQQDRFVGGAQEIPRRLAAALGNRVSYEAAVQAIEQDGRGVTVRSRAGTFRARAAIIALAPALVSRIEFAPALEPRRAALNQRMPMGSIIKAVVVYERAFWRERGLSGEAICDRGPVRAVMDDGSPDGKQAALVCFIAGDAALAWTGRPEEERQRAVIDCLVRFFGEDARHPTHYIDKDWPADPWSGGCYVGYMPPGVMTTLGAALREPCGRIHWAGTETATRWNGYFEGAIEAGERAADEVAARLRAEAAPAAV